jgi:Tol biopolymer transport system component
MKLDRTAWKRILPVSMLLAVAVAAQADASFRGINGRIAFQDNAGDDIWLMTNTGALPTNVTAGGGGFAHYSPACSPDGTRLAFIEVNDSNGMVMTSDTTGGNRRIPYGGHSAAVSPAWSPDGTRLAYSVWTGHGTYSLFVANEDGSNTVALTPDYNPQTGYDTASHLDPDWSPDGTKIAFADTRDGDWDIYTYTLATGVITQLTNSPGDDREPSWAPGGGRIAFTSVRSGSADIWVMKANGSSPVDITPSSPAVDRQASWSPDGKKIAFARLLNGAYQVFKMNTDGTAVKSLRAGVDPSWCAALPVAP